MAVTAMTISLDIILEKLSDLNIEPHPQSANREFTRIEMLTGNNGNLNPGWLYVCPLSAALTLAKGNSNITFFCLRDRFNTVDETDDLMQNIIVVNNNIMLTHLLSRVLAIYHEIMEWRYEMQRAYIKNKPMQELLILSEPIIENFISISDSSLSLITYTPNIPPEDPISTALLELGYHPEKTIQLFKEHNRFEIWNTAEGLIFDTVQITAPFPVVSKIFKYGGTYFTHVVMVCKHRPPTPGILDLFNILLENLSAYIDRDWQLKQEGSRVYDSLITNILDNTQLPTDVIADRIEQIGLPLKSTYRLFKLLPFRKGAPPVGVITHEVQELLPQAKVVVYHQSLLVIAHVNEGTGAQSLDTYSQKLMPMLDSTGFCCAVSYVFNNLKELRQAYSLASLTLDYGRKLSGCDPESPFYGPFFRYEDYYFYMLLSERDKTDTLMNGKPIKWLNALLAYDAERNTDNYGLLYSYLFNERHAGNTAKAAYMSRNNLVYRINRIKELLNIDFDDYFLRMSLLLTYELLKLQNLNLNT
jgi:sugar diacid utilization regulator